MVVNTSCSQRLIFAIVSSRALMFCFMFSRTVLTCKKYKLAFVCSEDLNWVMFSPSAIIKAESSN